MPLLQLTYVDLVLQMLILRKGNHIVPLSNLYQFYLLKALMLFHNILEA